MESPGDIVVLTDGQVQELMTPEESLSVPEQIARERGVGRRIPRDWLLVERPA